LTRRRADRAGSCSRTAENRTPAIYSQEEFVRAGGLISYGVELGSLYKRAATYVDKIIKGDAPADLPVEQPNVQAGDQPCGRQGARSRRAAETA
jgi:hypothetical protein